MGGQLSCVSCKNRKETTSPTTKTKKKVETQPTEVTSTSNVKYSPVTSGWELYQILQTSNGWIQKGEEKLSDVEKVARAIVEINVYLASQVIYPAIERYMRECQQQKSDVDKHEEDNGKKEEEEDEEEKEERKLRFSKVPHNEHKSSS